MNVVGHALVVGQLRAALPPVILLAGPPSVGKKTLARYLADLHHVAVVDRHTCPAPLSVGAARAAIAFVATAAFGEFKLVLIDLDEANEGALGALLKTLEEPPAGAHFVLTAAGPVLPTVASRASVYRLGLLSTDDVADVLIAGGMAPGPAARAAPAGRGRVAPALAAHENEAARVVALAVARSLATHDADLFEKSFAGFDEAARTMLVTWCVEVITGQWALYRPEHAYGVGPRRARRLLAALAQFPHARARLGVRAALTPLLTV